MKANALYHLIQLRARKLLEHLPQDRQTPLRKIQSGIHVERISGGYVLDWALDNKKFSFTLESDPFKFYEKGDDEKHNARRGNNLNYRRHNWDMALELWRSIYRQSNLDPDVLQDDGQMAFGRFNPIDARTTVIPNILIAMIVTLLSLFKASASGSVQVFIACVLLLYYAENMADVHLRKRLSQLEKLVIASGILIPVYYTNQLTGILLIIGSLFLLCLSERHKTFGNLIYLLSGVLIGGAIYHLGYFAILAGMVISALLFIIALIDRVRVSILSSMSFIAGFIVLLSVVYFLADINGSVKLDPQEIAIQDKYIVLLSIVFTIMLLVTSATWWIVGVQYYLMPWVSIISLCIGFMATIFQSSYDIAVMTFAFTGFNIFIFYRTLYGFFRINSPKNRFWPG